MVGTEQVPKPHERYPVAYCLVDPIFFGVGWTVPDGPLRNLLTKRGPVISGDVVHGKTKKHVVRIINVKRTFGRL